MKAYIGNKKMCLAQREDQESQSGYSVLYPDGSETWLVKEIFDFEYRPVDDEELQMIISTVVSTEVSEEDIKTMIDWDDLSPEQQNELELDMEKNPENYEVVEEDISMGELVDNYEKEVEDAK